MLNSDSTESCMVAIKWDPLCRLSEQSLPVINPLRDESHGESFPAVNTEAVDALVTAVGSNVNFSCPNVGGSGKPRCQKCMGLLPDK